MASIPTKVYERLASGLKKFQPILSSAKARDINESDTVTIVNDLLAYVLGFDKYSEITSEFVIRGTFVDLAIKLDGELEMLIEVKAIGLELKDAFIKQAVDYGANQGVEWVVLTNGVTWQVYHISFKQPITHELVLELDLLNLQHKKQGDVESLYLISREGIMKSSIHEFRAQKQALSRYFIGGMLLTDPILDVIRRELRRISPDVRIDTDDIRSVLVEEVLKREVIEGDRADEARKKINRSTGRMLRKVSPRELKAQRNSHDESSHNSATTETEVVVAA